MITEEMAKAQTVDAANRLFYARGLHSVTMDELAREARLPLKRLYGAFPSKNAVIDEVLRARRAEWELGIAAAAKDATTPREKILAIYDFLEEWFAQDDFRGCAFINTFAELGAISPSIASAARDHKRAFQDYVASLVSELGAKGRLAAQLALLAEGAQTTAAISGDTSAARDARDAARVLIDAAIPGAREPSRSSRPPGYQAAAKTSR